MDDYQAQLLTEQFCRLKDSIESRLKQLEEMQKHHVELEAEKLAHIKNQIQILDKTLMDHETRIRVVDDAVISNRTSTTIIQAGQAALTLIAATIAAWLGGRR